MRKLFLYLALDISAPQVLFIHYAGIYFKNRQLDALFYLCVGMWLVVSILESDPYELGLLCYYGSYEGLGNLLLSQENRDKIKALLCEGFSFPLCI